ncbi:MAG: hypothetical protein CL811_08680, partial [Colwelliaceae bacterium]|nr:hypothetical protein [Colwelliaceae bacterium]
MFILLRICANEKEIAKNIKFVVALAKIISIICGALDERTTQNKCRSLAQLVEQLAFNQFVEGSN